MKSYYHKNHNNVQGQSKTKFLQNIFFMTWFQPASDLLLNYIDYLLKHQRKSLERYQIQPLTIKKDFM